MTDDGVTRITTSPDEGTRKSQACHRRSDGKDAPSPPPHPPDYATMETTSWSGPANTRTLPRLRVQEGIANTVTIKVARGDNTGLCDQEAALLVAGWTTVFGYAVTPGPVSGVGPVAYRRNLILVDEHDQPVLQRIGAAPYNGYASMKASAVRGRELLQALQRDARPHNPNPRNPKPVFHLGVWTAQGHPNQALLTADTRQEFGQAGLPARLAAQRAVDDFLVWARRHADRFVQPILQNRTNHYQIHPAIQAQYVTRRAVYDWLAHPSQFPVATKICHPTYSMVTPFAGFSPGTHRDPSDTDFTCLVNFGAGCYLELADLQLRVHLQPFDIVFFQSRTLRHCTRPVESELDSEQRWAVSYYARAAVEAIALDRPSHDRYMERATAAEARARSQDQDGDGEGE